MVSLWPGRAWAGTGIGDYGVIVSKMLNRDPESKEPVAKPKPGAVVPRLVKPGHGMMDYIVLVPEAYGDAATSGLTASVKKGVNKLKFELRSDFSPPSAGTPAQSPRPAGRKPVRCASAFLRRGILRCDEWRQRLIAAARISLGDARRGSCLVPVPLDACLGRLSGRGGRRRGGSA